jgi:drug/metabolite transporter (DMT)-like permease
MSLSHFTDGSSETGQTPALRVATASSMKRAFVLVMLAIMFGLVGLYLVRAALVDAGGFTLGSSSSVRHLPRLIADWRFLAGGALLLVVLTISLEIYCNEELSKVVPLYSISYVLVAVIGQVFLHERVTAQRWIGIVVIVTGVVFVLRS